MELSPKQQTVENIKNAERILVLGNKNVSGDQLGSLLALASSLKKLEKKVEIVVSSNIPSKYSFLPNLNTIQPKMDLTEGKVIKIDTNKIPVSGMKWQKDDESLNIILDTDKNIKFEHIDIINGQPKPDLIIVVDTQSISQIDSVYDNESKIFLDVPIINIDHHSGNENYGTVNLVDESAVSTSEILVSLFEALGVKIDSANIATKLLTGIIEDTNSFQNTTTTPKSLTVAAQLLAAGAKKQEIIAGLYDKEEPKPSEVQEDKSNNDLMRSWNKLVEKFEIDKDHNFAWTKIEANKEDVFDATSDLLNKYSEVNTILLICFDSDGAHAKIAGDSAVELSKIFDIDENKTTTEFSVRAESLDEAEKIILKKIYDYWQGSEETKSETKEVWEAIEPSENELKNQDAIEEALRSIEQSQDEQEKKNELTSIRDVLDKKKEVVDPTEELDVFEEAE